MARKGISSQLPFCLNKYELCNRVLGMFTIQKKQAGFTLIELMIVVAIVGILAAVAIPFYQKQVVDGRRAEGLAFALDLMSRQERFYTENSRYSSTATLAADLGLTNGLQSQNGEYTVAVVTGAGNTTYTITLTPTNPDTYCGNLTLTNTGVRDVSGSHTLTAEECWR